MIGQHGKKKSKREKKRSPSYSKGMSGGAGLMRFFEDAGMGFKISPMTVVILAVSLILTVSLAHLGVFDWIF